MLDTLVLTRLDTLFCQYVLLISYKDINFPHRMRYLCNKNYKNYYHMFQTILIKKSLFFAILSWNLIWRLPKKKNLVCDFIDSNEFLTNYYYFKKSVKMQCNKKQIQNKTNLTRFFDLVIFLPSSLENFNESWSRALPLSIQLRRSSTDFRQTLWQ